jgi:PAS domain S-box-containing protein
MRSSLNTLSGRLLIGSAITLVLFVAVGLVSAVSISRLLAARALEKNTHEVIIQAFHLHKQVDRMRVALHTAGGLCPGPPEEYNAARTRFEQLAGELAEKVSDNPEQQGRVRQARRLAEGWDRLIRQQGAPLPASEQAALAVEAQLDDFIQVEEGLLDGRRRRADAEARQGMLVISWAAGLALVLTVLLAVQSARSVTRPIRRLREAAGQMLAGRFRTVPPAGPAEVTELIVHFNHMALTLAQRVELLQQQEERYRSYIGAVAHILWTTDAAGAVVGDLPSWRAFTGQSEEAVRGLGWLDAAHPDDRDAVVAAWRAAVASRGVFEAELRLRSARGEYRHFACRGVPLVNGSGAVHEWIGTCADITESKQRAALREAKEAAEAASRAKSEFLAKMSHELRTPLNAVIGMSKMLATQRFGPLTAKQADYLSDITKAGEHLLALINDILDLSKVEAGRMEVRADAFAVAEAVDNLLSTLRPLAEERGVALGADGKAGDGTLWTDAARFRQVLYNLLSNAIKFTPAGGSVVVLWDWVEKPEHEAAPADEAGATAVRMAVRDTGVGIATADQASVWEEFRQVQRVGPEGQQGTGLGLALTRRLVRLLGGTVWLESAVGRGSTFTFVLPRRLPPPAAAGERAAGEEGPRPLALVVEDHAPTHKLLCDWLGEAGFATASAFDGEAALEQARALRPALVVLDIQLPKADGWQVLAALKGDPVTSALPVVVVTVNEGLPPASGLEVREFFLKPIDRDDFLRRLQALEEKGDAGGAARAAG